MDGLEYMAPPWGWDGGRRADWPMGTWVVATAVVREEAGRGRGRRYRQWVRVPLDRPRTALLVGWRTLACCLLDEDGKETENWRNFGVAAVVFQPHENITYAPWGDLATVR